MKMRKVRKVIHIELFTFERFVTTALDDFPNLMIRNHYDRGEVQSYHTVYDSNNKEKSSRVPRIARTRYCIWNVDFYFYCYLVTGNEIHIQY